MKDNKPQRRTLKWGLLTLSLACLAFVSLLALSGCSDNTLVSSDNESMDSQTSFFDIPYDEAAFAKAVRETEAISVDGYISAENGGVIPADKHSFVVEPGAIPADTLIKIEVSTLSSRIGEEAFIYTFGPSGLVFDKPASLNLDLSKLKISTSSIDLFWLNEKTGLWEYQGTYYPDQSGIVHLPIAHFSKYGTRT